MMSSIPLPSWPRLMMALMGLVIGMISGPMIGLVARVVRRFRNSSNSRLQYLLGMNATKAALVELGLPNAQIKTEAFGTVKRDPTAKGAPSTEIAGKVVFQASDVTAPVPVDATILDVADQAGVFIDNACRSGTCGSCRVRLLSGSVKMAVEDALTERDKAEGCILACQAKIHGDVKVEA